MAKTKLPAVDDIQTMTRSEFFQRLNNGERLDLQRLNTSLVPDIYGVMKVQISAKQALLTVLEPGFSPERMYELFGINAYAIKASMSLSKDELIFHYASHSISGGYLVDKNGIKYYLIDDPKPTQAVAHPKLATPYQALPVPKQ